MRNGAVWMLRVLWFLLPLTAGPSIGDAASSTPHLVPQVLTVGLWLLWAVGLIATFLPFPVTLTIIRLLAPGALTATTWALFDTGGATLGVLAVAHCGATLVIALNHLVGDRFVDGASYGDERRFLLRPPAQLGFVVVPLVWICMAAGAAVGPLLLANHQWFVGAVASIAGAAALAFGARALHQLNLRWIVFVPTGMVLHDLTALTEPVLFRRTAIERLGPAISGTPARDLSRGAAGLLLECELTDAAPLGLRTMTNRSTIGATMTDVRRFLFAPTRPGELLDEAERRNIAVA